MHSQTTTTTSHIKPLQVCESWSACAEKNLKVAEAHLVQVLETQLLDGFGEWANKIQLASRIQIWQKWQILENIMQKCSQKDETQNKNFKP